MQKRRYQPSFFCADFLNTSCCFWHKHVFCKLFPFLFCCYAYPRKAMRSKVMQSKFQRIAIKISTLAFALLLCLLAFVFCTNTYFVNCYPFCFVAMHTIENQFVSKAIAIKISTLAFALYFVCLRLFLAQKSILARFLFLCVCSIYK